MSWKNFMSYGDADTILTEFSNDIKSRVSTKANQGLTAQQIANAKANIDIDKVPNVATNDQTPTFLEESTRTNIASGDKLSLIFGKIKKFFSDLKTVAFTGSYNDLDDKPTIPSTLADLNDDNTHRLVTDTEKTSWNNKCEGGNTNFKNVSIADQMDALKAEGRSGLFPFYISSANPDFSTVGYCMAIGSIQNNGVSTITAVNSQTGDIWTNGNTSQGAGAWRGWKKIDAVIDLGSISATSNNDSFGKAWDAITVYDKPVIVRWFYSGSFMALMLKYSGSQYGMAMAMKYNTTNVYTLSVNNGTKTYGNVGSDPIKTQSLNINIPAVSAGRGCVEYKALPTVSGYKAIGIIDISPIGEAGNLSLNSFFVNDTSAYISYENNKSSATAAAAVTLDILYIKT